MRALTPSPPLGAITYPAETAHQLRKQLMGQTRASAEGGDEVVRSRRVAELQSKFECFPGKMKLHAKFHAFFADENATC